MPNCRSTFGVARITADRVFIVDHDVGMSVTNDAENVVMDVFERHPDKRIIYRDTEGDWGELNHADGVFTGFSDYEGDHP